MKRAAIPKSPTHPSPLVIRWVDPRLPHIWQAGHEVDGEFRPFAGGSSEEALRRLTAKEHARAPFAGVSDRRRYRPGERLPFGTAPSRS